MKTTTTLPVRAGGPAAPPDLPPLTSPSTFARAAWDHWKKLAHAVGVVQTRLIMMLLYFGLVLPLGAVMRVRADPLHLRPRTDGNWLPHPTEPASLDQARRQF